MEFIYDKFKNELLFKTRGVTFPNVIESINEKGILFNFDHPNQRKYPNQEILVVEIDNYTYCVPYEIKGNNFFLITIYPSRKFKYLLED